MRVGFQRALTTASFDLAFGDELSGFIKDL